VLFVAVPRWAKGLQIRAPRFDSGRGLSGRAHILSFDVLALAARRDLQGDRRAFRRCAGPAALFAIAVQLAPRAGVGEPIGRTDRARRRGLPHQIVKANGVIKCPGAALRATVAVARRLDVKEFAQCADADCSDAGRCCSVVSPSAVRRLVLEVMGAAGAIAFTRCRCSSPIRCRPRLSITRRIAVGTVGRDPIAVGVIAAAGIGEPCGRHDAMASRTLTCPARRSGPTMPALAASLGRWLRRAGRPELS
jgi:hypothetical protein